jgi:hypothetical protein
MLCSRAKAPLGDAEKYMQTFEDIMTAYTWREIANCPGRYIARDIPPRATVSELLGCAVPENPMQLKTARDLVIVTPLENGGLISYRRQDGTYLHTLNTEDGFKRKLTNLGVGL